MDVNTELLFAACRTANLDLLRRSLDAGADVNGRDAMADSPLHVIVAASQDESRPWREALALLVSGGADLERENGFCMTPLALAAGDGNRAAVLALVECGAQVASSERALHGAAQAGHADLVRLLCRRGSPVDLADSKGRTALVKALLSRKAAAAMALLELGANSRPVKTDQRNTSLLALAVATGDLPLFEKLCRSAGLAEIAEAFEHVCSDPLPDDPPADTAGAPESATRTRMAQVLLDHGADPDGTKDDGSTILMSAAFFGRGLLADLLIEQGAQVNRAAGDGRTALMGAARKGHANVVKVLLAAGAEANLVDAEGSSALAEASRKGHAEVVTVLEAAGANPADLQVSEQEERENLGKAKASSTSLAAQDTLKDLLSRCDEEAQLLRCQSPDEELPSDDGEGLVPMLLESLSIYLEQVDPTVRTELEAYAQALGHERLSDLLEERFRKTHAGGKGKIRPKPHA
jgi:ankyrin repeat protein